MPIDLDLEKDLDPELAGWLAFAVQKIQELQVLKRAFNDGVASVASEFRAASAAMAARRASEKVHDPAMTSTRAFRDEGNDKASFSV